jgi:hypothetical protein
MSPVNVLYPDPLPQLDLDTAVTRMGHKLLYLGMLRQVQYPIILGYGIMVVVNVQLVGLYMLLMEVYAIKKEISHLRVMVPLQGFLPGKLALVYLLITIPRANLVV